MVYVKSHVTLRSVLGKIRVHTEICMLWKAPLVELWPAEAARFHLGTSLPRDCKNPGCCQGSFRNSVNVLACNWHIPFLGLPFLLVTVSSVSSVSVLGFFKSCLSQKPFVNSLIVLEILGLVVFRHKHGSESCGEACLKCRFLGTPAPEILIQRSGWTWVFAF